MTARTHDVIAFAMLATAAIYFPPNDINTPTIIASIIGNIVGSLIPDMDQASNRLWDLLPAGDYIGRVLRRVFLGHRTLSHSLLGFYFFYKLFEFILPKFLNAGVLNIEIVFASIMIGIFSHLVADAVTKDGIPLLFPIKFKFGFPPFSFLRIKTGGFLENFVVLPGIAIYIIALINNNQDKFIDLLKKVTY